MIRIRSVAVARPSFHLELDELRATTAVKRELFEIDMSTTAMT